MFQSQFLWVQCKLLTMATETFSWLIPSSIQNSWFLLSFPGWCVPTHRVLCPHRQPRGSAYLCQPFTLIFPMLANTAVEFIKSYAQSGLPIVTISTRTLHKHWLMLIGGAYLYPISHSAKPPLPSWGSCPSPGIQTLSCIFSQTKPSHPGTAGWVVSAPAALYRRQSLQRTGINEHLGILEENSWTRAGHSLAKVILKSGQARFKNRRTWMRMGEGVRRCGNPHLAHRAHVLGWDSQCPGCEATQRCTGVFVYLLLKGNQEPVGVEIRPLYLTEGTEAPSHPTQLQRGGEANPWTQPTVSEWRQGDVPTSGRATTAANTDTKVPDWTDYEGFLLCTYTQKMSGKTHGEKKPSLQKPKQIFSFQG